MASNGGGAPPGRSFEGLSLICLLTDLKALTNEAVSPRILTSRPFITLYSKLLTITQVQLWQANVQFQDQGESKG